MGALIDVILPVFLVLGFGYVAAWQGLFSESAVDGVMRFAQNFAVPVLLFRSIARLDLGASYDPGLMLSFYAGAFIAFGLGLTGARLLFKRPGTDAVAIGFCCLFSNSLLLGIPITERAYGTAALAGNFAIISVHSPLLYTFGITLMEGVRSHGSGATLGRVAVNALSGILRTPLVLGILAGFVVNLSGLALHGSIWAAVDMMASAALPTALFGLGGVLFRYRPEGDMKAIGMVTVLSLIVHPAVTYGLGRWGFGLETSALRSAVVTASMAPGVNAYLFASIYGVAKRVAASSVLLATAASILTVWAWLAILP
ncbi:AEC family transporter [Phaeovulum sp.]|uniref:AEC family transporter n=1 Tax=Phaeovulum sp. TaxID=2934796 RepID=UPI0027319C92|nr:AEC family transporter [Phaeovulum sp.]MDP1670085.1 AEC family transporter [Phaeovulum sp.]MDZ4118327.1 AEC family transporter [Phaeovulum sp.]